MATSSFEFINPRYLEGITDEPKQLLPPITGYVHEPLVSLEEACEPLLDIVPRLEPHIWVAKENSKAPSDGLTQDESAAIRLYTMEWKAKETDVPGSLYVYLNEALQEVNRTKLRPWFRYLRLFLTALAKLPPASRQTVWRGVRKDLSGDYSPGTELTWWAFSSCTTSLSVLESDLYLGNSGTRTLFSIEIFNGRTIRAHSHFQVEEEILLLPGTYFEVKSRLNPAPDLYIVHLQQKRPPHDLLEPPFEGAQLFPPLEQYQYKNPVLTSMTRRQPWYKKKAYLYGLVLLILTILLVILLASILGSRRKDKESSFSIISESIGNYNISTYSPVSVGVAFYSFDGNVLDLYNKHNGRINGSSSVNYTDGYVGYGQAIVLNQTNSTSIVVTNSFNFTDTDFTFELFILPSKNHLTGSLLQFSSGMELKLATGILQMIVTPTHILSTTKPLIVNQWYHIAIVHNFKQSLISLYIDGSLISTLEYSKSTVLARNENLTLIIGQGYEGAIDQLSISTEAKTNQRILWDATVIAYYPLDGQVNNFFYDSGPNSFIAKSSDVQILPGQIRNAASFKLSGASIQADGFTILNFAQHAFTIALWIRPSINPGIFLTIANSVSCLLILGLRTKDNYLVAYLPNSTDLNTGTNVIGSEILINRWTHITFTWSNHNRAQLYQNTVCKSRNHNATKLNNGYRNPMTIILGTYAGDTNCTVGDELDSTMQFTGSIDEFYVFSKELHQTEIETLDTIPN